jgi:DNA-binding MarR family transcriptional regulator
MNKPNPVFEQAIDIMIRQISLAESRATQEFELTDLSMKQVVCLETISRLGKPTFTELARELKVTKPSVTAIYRKLEARGYVTREPSQEDRRISHIHLTERGLALQAIHENLHRKIAEQIAANLSETEINDLVRLLSKVITHL